MNHYICSCYGISKQIYGSKKDLIGRMGEENSFLGEACKAKSCRIIKAVEIEELGVIIKSPITEIVKQRTTLAFIDDMSFFRNEIQSREKVQRIFDTYTKYYKATEGKVEQQKSFINS